MITININGLTLCHKGSGGVTHNTLPDVCKTPPFAIPVPYENEAYSADLTNGTSSVFADGGNMIANFGSKFARSIYDESGSMGGVKSGTNKAEADWISHSFDVFFEGKPACRLTDKMFMNHRNTVNMAGLVQDPLPELAEDMLVKDVPTTGDEAENKEEDKPKPMPCIVILVHGVNDVGEAYQNQETGIITGLNNRLSRTDLSAHDWKDYLAIPTKDPQKSSTATGRSPVIPFYWGYKPVTHNDYVADQKRYRDEVSKLSNGAKLPYDAYQENDPKKMAAQGNDGHNSVKFQNDCFKNTLDENYAKNGGTFANATTNIPDMLGPGSGGTVLAALGFATLYMNGGDFTHPIYHNPHRIYQFFAAQRLADLILQIRLKNETSKDVINIVAHSQGTIITMLANMLVKQAGQKPANCTIFNHSPYSLESRFGENLQEGHHQTTEAREKTLKNFCKLMATQYKGGSHSGGEIKQFEELCLLGEADQNKWHSDLRFSRNNNGKVYNYFCPDDGTVSLANIQGFGWRGIPQEVARDIPNLYQRVFYQHAVVGNKPDGKPFSMPEKQEGDYKTTPVMNASYDYEDVIVNGEELPEPFTFKLMGEDNHPDNDPKTSDTPYETTIDPDSPDQDISYSAKAGVTSRTNKENYSIGKNEYQDLAPGSVLNEEQLANESVLLKREVIYGVITGSREYRGKQLTWLKTREELEKEWMETDPVAYSQHSSIVMSKPTPSHSMAFDLAIGQCESFDFQDGKFWEALLHRADWRDPQNGFPAAKEYYQTGRLPTAETKYHMNKPDEVLPTGEFGVVNDYGPRQKPNIRTRREIALGITHGDSASMITITQWDMPKTLNDKELK